LQDRHLFVETFPALDSVSCRHAFIRRIPGIEVSHDKVEVLSRLDAVHREIKQSLQLDSLSFVTAEQVHGNEIAVVDQPIESGKCFPGCDGVITNQRGVCLGIYVADCCAVYIVDPKTPAIGLVHSGKKGTELKIISRAIELMNKCLGSTAADLIVQLSPCIRPPHYEIDFAAEIVRQCRSSGVKQIHDSGVCTACHLDLYYSYRAEKARTGRMLALLALR
jgi:copper oxidase (laccase) domain-containing protein